MPVTAQIVDHPATEWRADGVKSPEKLLEEACKKEWRQCQRIEQSSFAETIGNNDHITPSKNGFVWAAFHAYSGHHHLVIRPEDVWFAILSQLSFYINAHAEQLRSFFVSHQGQEPLRAVSEIRDFGQLSLQMADLMGKNVKDPLLRDWVMPDFTTTTHHDKVVGAVLFMGALQAYFKYFTCFCCGLPSITLLGEPEDWRKILQRLDKIDQLGTEAAQFASLLRPVLRRMILTFDEPEDVQIKSFWNRIVHHHSGSGADTMSGWLTAFCFWNSQGERIRGYMVSDLVLDGIRYGEIDLDDVCVGHASVPVEVDDRGDVFQATMVAGSVGISAFEYSTDLLISKEPAKRESVKESKKESRRRRMIRWARRRKGSTAASLPALERSELKGPSQMEEQDLAILEESPPEPFRNTIQAVSGWWIYRRAQQGRTDDVEKADAGQADAGQADAGQADAGQAVHSLEEGSGSPLDEPGLTYMPRLFVLSAH